MASPQLQQVIDAIKGLAGMASGSSVAELRATNEQMARPAEPDVTSEPVYANGVARPGSVRRAPRLIARCSFCMAAVTSWAR